MPNLPQSGIELVAQGASAYIADVGKAAHATDKFIGGLGTAAGKSGAFSEVMTGALRKVGEVAVSALGMAAQAAGKFLADSVTSAADVEQTLNVLGATSGATAAQLDQVRERAIALGGDLDLPNASAQDAAEAMLELSKAGFSVDEAMAAAKGTLQLAAAAQISAGEAAGISAQAINAFGLEAKDAAHVADLLAGGANASSASMTDLAQGLQAGGFAFHAAGEPIEDLITSLAALTNVGLTGSDAGTALKNAMMRLMNPTEKASKLMAKLGIDAYDATGKMLPWPEVLENIRKSTKGMTDEQRNAALGTIFLSDGMKAMIPLLNLSDEEYKKLGADVSKVGSAQDVAGAQTVGFNGAIAGLQSQMETLQLIIGTKLLPLLTPLIQMFSEGAGVLGTFASAMLGSDDAFNQLDDNLQGIITSIDAIVTGFNEGGIAGAAQQAGIAIMGALTPIAAGIVAQSQAWIAALGQWVINAIPGMGANFALFVQNLYTQVGAALPGIIAQLALWGAEFVAWLTTAVPLLMIEAGAFVASMLGYLQDNLPAIMAQLAQWTGQFILWLLNAIPPLIAAAGDLLGKILSWIIASLPGLSANLEKWGKAFVDWIIAAWPGMLSAFNDLDRKFTAWIAGLAQRATADQSVGKGIIDGMVGGITSAAHSLYDAAVHAVEGAVNAAKAAIKVGSPSKVFADEVGKPIPQGIAKGITDNVGMVTDAAKNLTDQAIQAATGGTVGGIGVSKSPSKSKSGGSNPIGDAIERLMSPVARPSSGGGSNTVNTSRVLNYNPTYGGATKGSPSLDIAMARSLAL